MKLAVPKIRLASSVGVFLADNSVAWCVLEKTLGVRQVDAGEEPCVKQDWAVALNKVLEKVRATIGPSATVVIGLPASQSFYATLPAAGKSESAETLLNNHHCCTAIQPQDLSADMLPVKVNGRPFSAVGAARRKDLQILIDVPKKLDFRFVRVEPAPWALLRSCSQTKNGKIALRLMVEGRNMLAMLVNGAQPLLWRTMELAEEDAWDSIVSLVRTFETYATQQLGVTSIDAIVLEGQDTTQLAERLSADLGERFSTIKGPGPTAVAVAKGLALGGLNRDEPAPDLARPLAPPPQLWDLVPRGEVAVLGAVIMCMALWLWGSGTVAANNARRAEEDNSKNALLHANQDAKLKEEKKTLSAEVQAVTHFLTGRVLWTEYLNQFSTRVPKGVQFVTFQGDQEFKTGSERNAKKSKRGLLLNFSTMLPRDKPAPPEIDELLENIRTAPVIVRDFPDVKLSQLRVTKSLENSTKRVVVADPATFSVTCEPKAKDKGSGAPAAKPADKTAVAGTH